MGVRIPKQPTFMVVMKALLEKVIPNIKQKVEPT